MYILHVLSDDLRAKRHATLPLHELNVKADALNAFLLDASIAKNEEFLSYNPSAT